MQRPSIILADTPSGVQEETTAEDTQKDVDAGKNLVLSSLTPSITAYHGRRVSAEPPSVTNKNLSVMGTGPELPKSDDDALLNGSKAPTHQPPEMVMLVRVAEKTK